MSSQLFYTYNSNNGSYNQSSNAIKNVDTYTYSLVFDKKRKTIWAQNEEYGIGLPIGISGDKAPNSTYSYVISGISVNTNNEGKNTISYTYLNVPSYTYISDNYETISYVRDAYSYIMTTIEDNEYVVAEALSDLDERVTNLENDCVTYTDFNAYISSLGYIKHSDITTYINNTVATNFGYVIGGIRRDGHDLKYTYVGIPTYQYLNNAYVNDVSLTKTGTGNIVNSVTISKKTTGGINSYVIDVSYTNFAVSDTYTYIRLSDGANNTSRAVSGIELTYTTTNPVTYSLKVAYADFPGMVIGSGSVIQPGEAISNISIDTNDKFTINVSYSYYVTPQYLSDFGYLYGLSKKNSGYVIGCLNTVDGKLEYSYVAVPTYEYLHNTGYSTTNGTLTSYSYLYTYTIAKSGLKISNGFKVTYNTSLSKSSMAYGDVYVPYMTDTQYGVAKTYHNATVSAKINDVTTDAGRYYGVQKNSDGKLVVNVPWSSSSTTGFITGDEIAYKDIFSHDVTADWDSTKQKVKVAEGLVVTYSNGSESISAYSDADLFVPVMSTTSYGVAKTYTVSTLSSNSITKSDTTKRYGVSITTDGFAYVAVPWSDTRARRLKFENVDSGIQFKLSYGTSNSATTYVLAGSGSTLPILPKMGASSYGVAKAPGTLGKVGINEAGELTYSAGSISDLSSVTYYDVLSHSITPEIYSDYIVVAKGYKATYTNGSTTYSAYTYSDIKVPIMTNEDYGVGMAYWKYNGNIPVSNNGYTNGDNKNRNYGVSIDDDGKLSVFIPEDSSLSLTSTGNPGSGNFVSSITLNNNVLTIAYTQSTAANISTLEQAILALQLEYDNLFGYTEVGRGRALRKTTLGYAYVDLTGLDGGSSGGDSVTSFTGTSVQTGYQLTINTTNNSFTKSITQMTSSSYGVAKLGTSTVISSENSIYPVGVNSSGQLYVDPTNISGGNSLPIFYGICGTISNTSTKKVICPEFTSSALVDGAIILVQFRYTNTITNYSTLTLNVNSTGAKSLKTVAEFNTWSGNENTVQLSPTDLSASSNIKSGKTYVIRYNGTYWVIIDSIDDGGSGGSSSNAITYDDDIYQQNNLEQVHQIQVVDDLPSNIDSNILYIIL
jgi:hypothetical protein